MNRLKLLGNRVRELRLAAGLKQAEVAKAIGVHIPWISKIEIAYHNAMPEEKNLIKLAEALNADPTELMLISGRIPQEFLIPVVDWVRGEAVRLEISERSLLQAIANGKAEIFIGDV